MVIGGENILLKGCSQGGESSSKVLNWRWSDGCTLSVNEVQ